MPGALSGALPCSMAGLWKRRSWPTRYSCRAGHRRRQTKSVCVTVGWIRPSHLAARWELFPKWPLKRDVSALLLLAIEFDVVSRVQPSAEGAQEVANRCGLHGLGLLRQRECALKLTGV